jgi:hypothetical protein
VRYTKLLTSQLKISDSSIIFNQIVAKTINGGPVLKIKLKPSRAIPQVPPSSLACFGADHKIISLRPSEGKVSAWGANKDVASVRQHLRPGM